MNGLEGWRLEEEAAAFLEENGVKQFIPAFSLNHNVVKGRRQRVQIVAVDASELVQDRVEGPGTKQESLAGLGHLLSKCSWMLQERWRVGEGSLMQNHFSYTHQRDPLPEKPIHVIGKSTTVPMGTHHLSFSIHHYIDGRRVPIGSGHSSLVIGPPEPITPALEQQHLQGDGSSDSSWLSSDANISSSSESGLSTPPPSPPPPMNRMPHNIGNPIIDQSSNGAAPTESPPLLNRRAASEVHEEYGEEPPIKKIRVESLEEEGSIIKEYMIVNFKSRQPTDQNEFKELMRKHGVDPQDITFETLPIRTRDRYVYRFRVTSQIEKNQVERMIERSWWRGLFEVSEMCESEMPFVFDSMSMEQIIESMFLTKTDPEMGDDLGSLLTDKKNIGKVIQDNEKKRSVIEQLTKKGNSQRHANDSRTARDTKM
ncbi:hypothetical protein CAEBREN_05744 [Caenorhabditis brenneri]|uniref:Uncharacterized protein n=1 Tax=Caenorhabditis brenneri TaxID=135651 RepID=G0MRC0_CAEBE|nr:hypothetical protein CAEBREN_05744 [Caenorhabditis brenneri]